MTSYVYKYMRFQDEVEIYEQMEKEYLKQNIDVLNIKNGVILPQKKSINEHHWMGDGGVIDNNGDFVNLSGILGFGENEGEFVFGGSYEYEKLEEKKEDVLYMGAFQPHWGHFLLEYITRLWYWIKYKPTIKIAYCGFACEPDSIDGNYLEILNLLGIEKNRLIDIRNPTRFLNVIIPEQSYLRGKYYSLEYKLIINTLKDNASIHISKKPYENLYFTRVDFMKTAINRNKERGEDPIVELFKKNNFTIISPERISATEQIFYISHCKKIITPIGGASMNLIFAKEGCEVILLKKAYLPDIPADMHIISCINHASQVIFLDVYFKPYSHLPYSYGYGPHMLGITKELKLYIKDNDMTPINRKNYLKNNVLNFFWLTKKEIKRDINKLLGRII